MEVIGIIIIAVVALLITSLLPKLLKFLFWILVISVLIVLWTGISYQDLFAWAKEIVLWEF